MTRKVAFSCDHAAFHVKDQILAIISSVKDVEAIYMGPPSDQSVDYPDYAEKAATAVVRGEVEKAVLLCGTGIGISIAANKVHGARAALCHDHLTAVLAREHNNANIVCAGERVCGIELLKDIIVTFLTTDFSGGERHCGRIAKIAALENKA